MIIILAVLMAGGIWPIFYMVIIQLIIELNFKTYFNLYYDSISWQLMDIFGIRS